MPIRLLRVIVPVHAGALLTQAVLAGQFLAGQDAWVVVHEWTAWTILGLAILQTVIAFARMAQAGAAALSFAIVSLVVLLGEALQLGTGYARFAAVHVPLAFLIFGCTVWQTTLVLRPRTSGAASRR